MVLFILRKNIALPALNDKEGFVKPSTFSGGDHVARYILSRLRHSSQWEYPAV